MSQEDSHEGDQSPDHWCSRFEDECFGELEAEGRIESRLQSAEEHTAQQLWMGFQQTSTAIAQLYNCKDTGNANDGYLVLVPFNKAAESLTKFYKDSMSSARECLRLGVASGRSSRSRELAAWARKKRKSIRRDELLAYLCGKSLPPHHRSRQNRSIERQIPRYASHQVENIDSNDYSVRDSHSLQGLNCAMSNINVGLGPRASAPSTCTVTSFSRPATVDELRHHEPPTRGDHHHRKRTNSSSSPASMDVCMESPSRKRGRFL